jgi:hypothetical protein
MKRGLFAVGLGLVCACSLVKTSSTTPTGPATTTTPDSSTPAPPASDGEYRGADAVWVVDVKNYRKGDAEELIRAKGFTGQIVTTGDTDPKFERDEQVCQQTPDGGKIAPNGVITLKYCNTYKPMDEGPELAGVSVADAEKKARDAGFTGEFTVTPLSEYDQSCKEGNVCRVDPFRWYMTKPRFLTLYTNHKVSISTPDQ